MDALVLDLLILCKNLKGKNLLDYTNLFSPNEYEKTDKTTLEYFQQLKRWKKSCCIICGMYRKFEERKISCLLKNQFFLLFAVSARMKMKNYLKKKSQFRYSKLFL